MNRSSIALTTLTALIAVLPLSACSTQVSTCNGEVCSYRVSGKPTLEVELGGGAEQDLKVEAIEQGLVSVSSRGQGATLRAGAVATVGGLAVRVVSVEGSGAELEVRRG